MVSRTKNPHERFYLFINLLMYIYVFIHLFISEATLSYIAEYDGIAFLYSLLKKFPEHRDLKLAILDLFGYLSSNGTQQEEQQFLFIYFVYFYFLFVYFMFGSNKSHKNMEK